MVLAFYTLKLSQNKKMAHFANSIFTKSSKKIGQTWQLVSIGSSNCSVSQITYRLQITVIVWTNVNQDLWCYIALLCYYELINKLRLRRKRRQFADDIFKCIFLNENVWIWIKISMKFISKGPIYNISALVQIMAWHQPGDKPLS